MENKDSVLQEVRRQIQDLYAPDRTWLSTYRFKIALAVIDTMIATQSAAQKIGTAMANNIKKHAITKSR